VVAGNQDKLLGVEVAGNDLNCGILGRFEASVRVMLLH
jgi:hypothetical protein